jgi:hypothetical protein
VLQEHNSNAYAISEACELHTLHIYKFFKLKNMDERQKTCCVKRKVVRSGGARESFN